MARRGSWMRGLRRLLGIGAMLAVAAAVALAVALSQTDLEDHRDTLTAKVHAATGRALRVEGDMSLALGLSPTVRLAEVRFANAPWAEPEAMLRAESVEVDLALLPLILGDIVLDRIALVRPDIRLIQDVEGRRNWDLDLDRGVPGTKTSAPGTLPRIERLDIVEGRIALHTPGRDTPIRLDLKDLSATRRGEEGYHLAIAGALNDTALEITGTLGTPEAALRPDGRLPLDLTLATANSAFQLSGEVLDPAGTPRVDLGLRLESQSPARLAALAGFERLWPAGGAPVSLSGRLGGTWPHFALNDLAAHHGDTHLTGRVKVDLSQDRPRIEGEVNAPVLDLRPWRRVAAAGNEETDIRAKGNKRLFPATPLPFAALDSLDAHLDIQVGQLHTPRGLRLESARLGLDLKAGTLRLAPVNATLAGGRIAGEATFTPTGEREETAPPRLTLNLTATDIAYGRLLAQAGVSDGVEGQARGHLNLTADGPSPRALAASLEGRASFTAGEGRIAHRLLKAAGTGLDDLLAPWRETADDVALTCAIARFDIAGGIATAQTLLADTDTATLGGEGQIDLKQEHYDLRLLPRAKKASLMSLAVPVRVTGPLHAPHLAPDALGAARAGAITLGTLVNPLATIAALIVDSQTNDANPCVAALEKAARQRPGAVGAAPEAANENNDGESFFDSLGRRMNETFDRDTGDEQDLQPLLHQGDDRQGR